MCIRKKLNVGMLVILLLLTSCGVDNKTSSGEKNNIEITEKNSEVDDKIDNQSTNNSVSDNSKSDSENDLLKGDRISQAGAYGMITLTVPEQWDYKTYAADEDGLSMGGDYGIIIYPKDEEKNGGHIEIAYSSFFGVCGTGLETQELTLADDKAYAGYYDGSKIWNYVCFEGKNKGIVAHTYAVDEWWDDYKDDVMLILNTLNFEIDKAKGAIGVYDKDSDDSDISFEQVCSALSNSSHNNSSAEQDREFIIDMNVLRLGMQFPVSI